MNDETQTTGTDAPAQADTADAQTSEADVQTNSDAPEATQAVEEKQTAEVKAEETAEQKLYAGKYKTPEEMEKAYKELESKFGKTASERAELNRMLNEGVAPETDTSDYRQDSAAGTTDRLERDIAVMKFMNSHSDAEGKAMLEVLQSDPHIPQITGYEAKLEYAYLRSQNMTKSTAIAEAEKKGANQAMAKTAEKQVAQVEAAKSATPMDEDAEMYDRATGNYDRATRDQARMAIIRKNLINL